MPVYEYACVDCGERFETLVRSDNTPECPQCLSTNLKKQIAVFATTNPCSLPLECAPCCGVAGGCNPNGPPISCGFS